MSVGNPAHSS
ncbi:hypothetical protein YPPY34_1847, partial [Yersinia pestis PY-34]